MSTLMIVRDIRPDGTVIRQWITPAHMQLYLPPDVIHGEPVGPWERQYGLAGEDRWATLFRVAPETTLRELVGVSPIAHAVQQIERESLRQERATPTKPPTVRTGVATDDADERRRLLARWRQAAKRAMRLGGRHL